MDLAMGPKEAICSNGSKPGGTTMRPGTREMPFSRDTPPGGLQTVDATEMSGYAYRPADVASEVEIGQGGRDGGGGTA